MNIRPRSAKIPAGTRDKEAGVVEATAPRGYDILDRGIDMVEEKKKKSADHPLAKSRASPGATPKKK
jgi:hypothetical protein